MGETDFCEPLILEYLNGRRWRLVQAFTYHSQLAERAFIVPAGFVTDFASIPRCFWRVLPPTGEYGKAAVVHDGNYRENTTVTRKMADDVFLEGMRDLSVPAWKAQIMYHAVRLFGRGSYKGTR